MIYLGIDPGPTSSGLVKYDEDERRVTLAWPRAQIDDVINMIRFGDWDRILIEAVQSQGVSGQSLLDTAFAAGRMMQAARTAQRYGWMAPRSLVLSALDVHGSKRDSLVIDRCYSHHGLTRSGRAYGPLAGVSSHAWQALGLVIARITRPDLPGWVEI